MESGNDTSVLLQALPPATDYVTYLMLLEYNLQKEDLPLLHDLLQDEKLTVNIGWDLIQILLPLLPESEQCLHDVAALGNPREVVLKVDEQLEQLARRLRVDADVDQVDSDDDTGPASDAGEVMSHDEGVSLLQTLLQMLCVLHPRIKTKRPSSFLETSIVPVRQAYGALASSPAATRMVLMFIKAMSGSKRPKPPPRNQELQIPSVIEHNAAPDPEGQAHEEDPEEAKRQRELLQSLLTHVIALHFDSLSSDDLSSTMAWTDRVVVKRMPDRFPAFRKSRIEAFQQSEELRLRDVLLNQVLMIAIGDLKMDAEMVVQLLVDMEAEESEFSPSRIGLLYILAAMVSNSLLLSRPLSLQMAIFPRHDSITTAILGEPDSISPDVSPLTADALILSGWFALDKGGYESDASVKHDDSFNKYLQKLSALAATHPTPTLRTHAHLLMTTTLHSHKSSSARLTFIDDTLQFCPFSNLREAAVGWAKTEFMSVGNDAQDNSNVFTKPATLDYLSQHLFMFEDSQASVEQVLSGLGYHLAALNFMFFLCNSRTLSQQLDVASTIRSRGIKDGYLRKLKGFIQSAKTDAEVSLNADEVALMDLDMLGATIDQALDSVQELEQR